MSTPKPQKKYNQSDKGRKVRAKWNKMARIPHRMPRSKSEAVVFRHMGYVVPELD